MRALASTTIVPWVAAEFAGADIGDQRLNRRLVFLMSDIISNPGKAVAAAVRGVQRLKAASRFLQNRKVTVKNILEPHVACTVERSAAKKVVLVVQDTTSLNFSSHESTEGLGHIGSAKGRGPASGLFVHTAMAVCTSGTPIGLLSQSIWSRKLVHHDSGNERRKRLRATDQKDKESHRWEKTMSDCSAALGSQTQMISVCDRECDIFEFMRASVDENRSFVVRAKNERKVSEIDDGDVFHLSEAFANLTPIAKMSLGITGNSSRPARCANVLIYSRRVTLQPPGDRPGQEPVNVTVLHVVEKTGGKSRKRISWLLLTDLEVDNAAAALEIVRWYSFRWRIEEFHKVLKSGYQIEDSRLSEVTRLTKMAVCRSIAALRICQLVYTHRQDDKLLASEALSEAEWKCAYLALYSGTKPLPKRPPTLKQAIEWIAQLGGYTGGKKQNPGITTIWRGWRTLSDSLNAWNALSNAGFATYG